MKQSIKSGILVALIYAGVLLLLSLMGQGSMQNAIVTIALGLVFGFLIGLCMGGILVSNTKVWIKGGLLGVVLVILGLGAFFLDKTVWGILHGTFMIGEGIMYLPLVVVVLIGMVLGGFITGTIIALILEKMKG